MGLRPAPILSAPVKTTQPVQGLGCSSRCSFRSFRTTLMINEVALNCEGKGPEASNDCTEVQKLQQEQVAPQGPGKLGSTTRTETNCKRPGCCSHFSFRSFRTSKMWPPTMREKQGPDKNNHSMAGGPPLSRGMGKGPMMRCEACEACRGWRPFLKLPL